ncbi:MAG TPA: hypothetical protein PLG77_12335, partial [Burkholderiaceae bacterium]|nr:hypothetical protein [Burkholderiaceae bacterium]
MKARRRTPSQRLAAQAVELSLAAPQVVAQRVARMARGGAAPSTADRREFARMGTEKVAAFWQSWFAMGMVAWQQSWRLWSGAAGSGKSQIISDCIPQWIKQGSRVCLASLEMKGEQTLRRMCKQTGGVDRPTAPFIQRILDWLDGGLLLYERVGKAGVPALLEVFDYARAKYGCDQFIIDSLMRLGIAQDDYNGQEKAVFQIVDWTIQHNVHMHLVAHSR